MRRGWKATFTAAALTFGVAACAGDEGMEAPPEEPLFPADYAQTYTMVRDCRFSIPHPSLITVHASPVSANAYTSEAYPLPQGTVLVKTLYSDTNCEDIAGWAVMQKREPGFAPASGDWYWQEVSVDRVVTNSGVIQSCVGCHSSCTSRDWTCAEP